MKLIKSKELKEGNWFRTKPIYNSINKNNKIVGTYWVCYVKEVKGNDIHIDTWTIKENELDGIVRGGMFKVGKGLYLLNKKERMEFNKRLILLSLEEKNGIYG